MPTLGESPEATSVLRDIKPKEVSGVDVPAIGEPHFVIKSAGESNRLDNKKSNESKSGTRREKSNGARKSRSKLKFEVEPGYDSEDSHVKDNSTESIMTKSGEAMATEKLDESQVPRSVMKAIHKRLQSILSNVNEISNVVKTMKSAEDGENTAPRFLVEMTKSAAAEIRSFLPDNEISIQKRGTAESVLSLQSITKRADEIAKANAVSYLVRDRWVNVAQSVSEYLTTYIDGMEHDDDGPMLIPDGLDSTVDKASGELEGLVAEYATEESAGYNSHFRSNEV
jgi:hypothetical protein